MKWISILALGLLATQAIAETPAPKPQDKEATEQTLVLKTQQEKVSYSIGTQLGRNFVQDGVELDIQAFVKGLKDVLSGGKLLMTDEEIRNTMIQFRNEMMQKQAQERAKAAEENKKAGDAFLSENKKKEGVITLPSGLQYKVIKAGAGKKPAATDTVECSYRGTLLNGKEFDSSDRYPFKVNGVIRGWTEALKLMPVGSKWQLFIPSDLAYGEEGNGPDIGPDAVLIFDIELLAIK